jgi:ABC-type Fe3+-hydroxamate transport system substrate-binding protein
VTQHGSRGASFRRIVSLIPSITETVIELGGAERLVGRTRYCVEPAGAVDAIDVVGGTKNPDCERIGQLRPDLVIMSAEENRREDHERLASLGLTIHVIHPRSVTAAVDMIESLGNLLDLRETAAPLVGLCRAALADAEASASLHDPVRVFCPIWRNPWMTFRAETYVGSMLATCGMENVFAGMDNSADFFEIATVDVVKRSPALVVLPDEPYPFEARHYDELRSAGVEARCATIDGKDLSWYGPRIPRALHRLCAMAESAALGGGC